MNNFTYINDVAYDNSNDGYEHLLDFIRTSFENAAKTNEPMFTTTAGDGLYEIFLENLPEEARQHYNCNTCRNFVNHYGGIVTVDDDGLLIPVMWDAAFCPNFFVDAVRAVHRAVRTAKITGVFMTSEKRLGMPKTGVWSHMAVSVPRNMQYVGRYGRNNLYDTAYQAACKKDEDFKMLMNAALKYKVTTVETAVNLLRSETLYRGEKHLGNAEWFLDVVKLRECHNKNWSNILRKKAATAPAGFCHISSGMIGTLLDDIEAGFDFETVKNRFDMKMNPLRYQRPKANPTAGNVAQAEKIVAKLGLENSLKRRFARLDEIPTIWKPHVEPSIATSGGIFAGIKTKQDVKPRVKEVSPYATTMTWEKFQRTVLPMAKKIEFKVGFEKNGYAALVTAEDSDANPIIVWDKEDTRNPVNWYFYHKGSYGTNWNLNRGYTEVTAITKQPNLWTPGYEHYGKGVMLILKNCKDPNNTSSALFPEHMIGELREVRSTIEAYSSAHAISGYDEASACGIMLQSGGTFSNCELRVTTDVGVSLYKLDRWD